LTVNKSIVGYSLAERTLINLAIMIAVFLRLLN